MRKTRKRRAHREAPEVGAMAQRVIRALVKRAADGDGEALEELLKLEAALPTAIRDAGAALHNFGYSYTELGAIAGVSRQAARIRFTQPDDAAPNMVTRWTTYRTGLGLRTVTA